MATDFSDSLQEAADELTNRAQERSAKCVDLSELSEVVEDYDQAGGCANEISAVEALVGAGWHCLVRLTMVRAGGKGLAVLARRS